jgi:hypothetical protein
MGRKMKVISSVAISLRVCTINAGIIDTGRGYSITISGGTRPHIGAVAFAVPHTGLADKNSPSATVSMIQAPGHRDGLIAVPVAEALAKRFGEIITVAAGVHIGDPEAYTAPVESIQEIIDDIPLIIKRIVQTIDSKTG